MKIKSFLLAVFLVCSVVWLFPGCKKKETTTISTCSNGIKDGDETGVDCGGSCSACPPDLCKDGINNNGEDGIDCGGTCGACINSCSISRDGLNIDLGNNYTALLNSSTLTINYQLNGGVEGVKLIHIGALAVGDYALGSNTTYKDYNDNISTFVSGSIKITFINTSAKLISGIFSFVCHDAKNNIDHSITNGKFTNVYYQ